MHGWVNAIQQISRWRPLEIETVHRAVLGCKSQEADGTRSFDLCCTSRFETRAIRLGLCSGITSKPRRRIIEVSGLVQVPTTDMKLIKPKTDNLNITHVYEETDNFITEALRYCTRCQKVVHTLHSYAFIHERNEPYLPLPHQLRWKSELA